jgi:hypothetical protein
MSPPQSVAAASELYESWRRTTDPSQQGAASQAFEDALSVATCETKACPHLLRSEIVKRSSLYGALRNAGKSMFEAYLVAARSKLPDTLFVASDASPEAAQ